MIFDLTKMYFFDKNNPALNPKRGGKMNTWPGK